VAAQIESREAEAAAASRARRLRRAPAELATVDSPATPPAPPAPPPRLGFTIVDTGAIYRAVALAAQRAGVAWDDDDSLGALLDGRGFQLSFADDTRVLLNGDDVTAAIRTPEISRGASIVSARPVVRRKLLGLQRNLGRGAPRGAVLEGRDVGTVVFPDADVKFFLTASDEARAARRQSELKDKGVAVDVSEVLADQRRRDRDDSERAIAPLKPAPDAVVMDTTAMDLGQVVDECLRIARARLATLVKP
jgi:cytidylate kinase